MTLSVGLMLNPEKFKNQYNELPGQFPGGGGGGGGPPAGGDTHKNVTGMLVGKLKSMRF